MRKLIKSGMSTALLAVMVLGLGACAKHEEPAPVAALPRPPPAPPSPPAPTADDLLQAQLGQTGAHSSNGGWSIILSSGKFHAGKVSFSADEQAKLETIATLLKSSPHLRLQIENYSDRRGKSAHVKEQSQMQANAVLRALTSSGADESQLQAQGEIDTSQPSRVEIIFSNAEGEFHPAPVENS